MSREDLKKKAGSLPDSSGVYMMKDAGGKVIYVGKANSLRKRVRSYFQKPENLDRKSGHMVKKIEDLAHINTESEVEALILESNLIKEYRPRYNIMLKDDKRYPHIIVTLNEPFPRVLVTRKIKKDGAKYFGPYTAATKMRTTLATLRSIFPIRSCSYRLPDERPERACLDFHIGKCLAPCLGHQSEEEYRNMIDEVCLFLSGRQEEVKNSIRRSMEEDAAALKFEKAADLRDRLAAIESIGHRQRVLSAGLEDYDVVALSRDENVAVGVILKIREGKLLGIEHHYISNLKDDDDGVILSLFMARYYLRDRDFPGELLLPFEFEDLGLIQRWLDENNPCRIKVTFPKRGNKRRILELAVRNAELFLEEIRSQQDQRTEKALLPLDELQKDLSLDSRPVRISCFDISNLGDSFAVGSMVTFQNGKPDKSRYKKFKIRTVRGQDDFAMMSEVVGRFASRCISGEEEIPNLIVVDGGKGQLSAALKACGVNGLDVPLVAIAKGEEELFLPGSPDGLRLSKRSGSLSLLVRIRDEAHRFAVSYHRKLRERAMTQSFLEDVRGIGPKRRKQLLEAFISVDELARASAGEIALRGRIPLETAERLKEFLGGTGAER